MANSQTPFNPVENLIVQFDQALRTLVPGSCSAQRPSPAKEFDESEMSAEQRKHAAALMRINHTGEVCAQALYQGQALTAKLPDVRLAMEHAAQEETDHLAWCEDRIKQLDSHTSYLNPAWYAMSFGIGAAAGIAGDKWSLGFVAETEKQVCEHLREHLDLLPESDEKSQAVLEQMIIDEQNHGETAKQAGGADLPLPIKAGMQLMSKVMKKAAYRI
ncbi:MAG: 2-polyprenyl-3-methyl-6-methoxy-1,4-benzoquinone monooxygenase [Pseudohongiellaceae bacterium]|nr:2-polyprenyl-3-methyl-6-methoxy-1,4-benzoquinone monooxygenase [Pseudohongiellaceae bacterium]